MAAVTREFCQVHDTWIHLSSPLDTDRPALQFTQFEE
jgi:hypothetical protein